MGLHAPWTKDCRDLRVHEPCGNGILVPKPTTPAVHKPDPTSSAKNPMTAKYITPVFL